MELTFLGSGNAFAQGGRYWSSFLVDRRYLFDAPPTLLPHLKRLEVPAGQIEVIFISHFHGDHFMGLPFLFLEYVYLTERKNDLVLVGPPGIRQTVEEFAERCYPNVTKDVGYCRRYVEASPGEEQTAGPLTFKAYPMNHVKESLQAFGYRVNSAGKTVAYTGDTMLCDEIFDLADGADILVLDCTYTNGSGPEHMGLGEIKTIRKKIGPETTIILTHLNGDPETDGLTNIITADDLASYTFP
jgi:ribonuclease BN (tRNA processing enzyme)